MKQPRWENNASLYDMYRPQPPEDLILMLVKLHQSNLNLVVDLGCGTGLATRPWSKWAEKVIGIDPSPEMLKIAESKPSKNLEFMLGFGNNTGLFKSSVDLIICQSAIHWMEPESTLKEILRILKPNGMLVILGHNFPPVSTYLELDNLYFQYKSKLAYFIKKFNLNQSMYLTIGDFSKWLFDKKEFEIFREFYFSDNCKWDFNQYLGFIESQGDYQVLVDKEITHFDLGINSIKEFWKEKMSDEATDLLFNWRVDIFKNKQLS